MNIWDAIETENDAKFGKGKWHCDDIADAKAAPACVLAFLAVARAPAHGAGRKAPKLFATLGNTRVRIVMASRLGDVGVTSELDRARGYEGRVYLPTLSDFSTASEMPRETRREAGLSPRTEDTTKSCNPASDGGERPDDAEREDEIRTGWQRAGQGCLADVQVLLRRLDAERATAARALAKMRLALMQFGVHRHDCVWKFGTDSGCTCGFHAALSQDLTLSPGPVA